MVKRAVTEIVRVTRPINPVLVRCPDGREGVLHAAMGAQAIVGFGECSRFVYPYPLITLLFNGANCDVRH
jgi:hypothetical protein